jgi:hypothetical protein
VGRSKPPRGDAMAAEGSMIVSWIKSIYIESEKQFRYGTYLVIIKGAKQKD